MLLWKAFKRTLRAWWQALTPLVVLNTAWMLLQLPLLTAPLATAVFAALLHTWVNQGEIEYNAIAPAIWALWRDALRWGALNLLVWGILAGNFLLSWHSPALIWWFLRPVWALTALVWFTANLYFWPHYFRAPEATLFAGLRASARFTLAYPGLALGGALFALISLLFSVVLTFFLVVAWMSWVGLLAEYLVELAPARQLGD